MWGSPKPPSGRAGEQRSGGIADDATQVVVGNGPVRGIGAVGVLDRADVARRVVATVRRADGGDRRLLQAEPAPFDEHATTLRPVCRVRGHSRSCIFAPFSAGGSTAGSAYLTRVPLQHDRTQR